MASEWSDMIEFVDDFKYCRIVKPYTLKQYYTRKNRLFRNQIKHYIHDTTRTN